MSLDSFLAAKEQNKPQTDFERFRPERTKYQEYYGKISDQKIEEAGQLLIKLYNNNQSALARHIYTYFHLETKQQLKANKRYSHVIRAMYFTGI